MSIDADAEVDGLGFDLGLRYARDRWGAGAVYRGEVRVEGEVRPRFDVPPVPDPVAAEQVAERIAVSSQPWQRRVELPAEAAVGAWFRPFRAVRAEFDVVHTAWSDYDENGDPRTSTARRHDFDTDDRQAHPRFGLRESRFESEAWVAGLTVRYGWWW
ncbi:MAG TPA: hypothetical protein VHM02_03370 [Thermoanaerobaculia bacterium]|nr:hypothetical protein [Thermoanaerobaculia bacterium]